MALINLLGQNFVTGESGTSKLHSVACIELYQFPWLPVIPGNFLRCRCNRYNLLSIDLLLPQKSAHSSCDLTDWFIITVMSTCHDIMCEGY